MKPILYLDTETAFETNGIGILNDAVSCSVKRKINATNELEMRYPVIGIHFSEIKEERIILAMQDQTSRLQPYRIYKITKPFKGVVTVYARHISYDMHGIPVAPFSCIGAQEAVLALKSNAVLDCLFTFHTDKSSSAEFGTGKPVPLWNMLGGMEGSLLDIYGGEYEFDRFDVYLRTRLGADNGVTVRYGKNLTDLEQHIDCSSVYTGVYPYWYGEGKNVELPEKIVTVPGKFSFKRILLLDLTEEWETEPTEEQLRSRTEKYISDNDVGIPNVSTTFSFVNLDQTAEYRHLGVLERVSLGDTVSVFLEKMDITATARAVEVDFDPLHERYNSVTIGNVRANFAKTIAENTQAIKEKPSQTLVQSIVMSLTASILGARGGAVRLLDTNGDGMPDELYVADNADPALAVKVWRWNYEGWAGSRNGYAGPFTLGATLEDGLLAEAVTAARLVAGTIQSADGESFFVDLDKGIVKIKAVSDLEGKVTEVSTKADGISAEISRQTQEVDNLRTEMVNIQATAGAVSLQVQSILDNGVDKVKTKMGYTFNDEGLHVEKEGDEISNQITNRGVYVNRGSQTMLRADASGVVATDVTVNNYLRIAHSRFEKYSNGKDAKRTALFFVEEVS